MFLAKVSLAIITLFCFSITIWPTVLNMHLCFAFDVMWEKLYVHIPAQVNKKSRLSFYFELQYLVR